MVGLSEKIQTTPAAIAAAASRPTVRVRHLIWAEAADPPEPPSTIQGPTQPVLRGAYAPHRADDGSMNACVARSLRIGHRGVPGSPGRGARLRAARVAQAGDLPGDGGRPVHGPAGHPDRGRLDEFDP